MLETTREILSKHPHPVALDELSESETTQLLLALLLRRSIFKPVLGAILVGSLVLGFIELILLTMAGIIH
jgi:hypothetical protein